MNIYKVYGAVGHRQKESFCDSAFYNWTKNGVVREAAEINADKTGTNKYTVLAILADNAAQCGVEMEGQVSDGIFENCTTGAVELVFCAPEITEQMGHEWMEAAYMDIHSFIEC